MNPDIIIYLIAGIIGEIGVLLIIPDIIRNKKIKLLSHNNPNRK